MAGDLKTLVTRRVHDRELRRCASQYLQGRLIDIGCGEKPYEALLSEFVTEHIGVDHEATLHETSRIDLFGSAYEIPDETGAFDSAICTAVLEHLEEPEQALRECMRVLRPGGVAIYSVPFIWHIHEEPRDFFRYSKFGLRYLFEKVGAEILELRPLSGFWLTFGQLLVYNIYRLNRGPLRWLRIVDGLGILIQWAAFGLDKLDRTEQWTWMYLVVARKR